MGFRAGGKRRRFFMSHMNPSNLFMSPNRVRDSVERIAGDSVNSLDSCRSESIHKQVRYLFLRHWPPCRVLIDRNDGTAGWWSATYRLKVATLGNRFLWPVCSHEHALKEEQELFPMAEEILTKPEAEEVSMRFKEADASLGDSQRTLLMELLQELEGKYLRRVA